MSLLEMIFWLFIGCLIGNAITIIKKMTEDK